MNLPLNFYLNIPLSLTRKNWMRIYNLYHDLLVKKYRYYAKLTLVILVLLLVQNSGGVVAAFGSVNQESINTPKKSQPALTSYAYVPGEVLVKYKTQTTWAEQAKIAALAGKSSEAQKIGPNNKGRILRLKLKRGMDVKKALKVLRSQSDVLLAEPNYRYKLLNIPNDTYFTNQWGLNNTGQAIKGVSGVADADIDAPEAWSIESSGTTIAVIDSGIDQSHPDLSGRLWQNTGEIPDNGLDDDGNGYIDDVNGYNWAGISQSYANSAWPFGYDNTTQGFAQSIKGTGRELSHIGILLAKHSNPTGDIVVSIRNSISGSSLASFTIYPSEVKVNTEEIYKQLSSSVTLTDGDTYYLVVTTTNNNTNNYYWILDNSDLSTAYLPNTYRDGQEYDFNGANWQAYANDDLYFHTNANANVRDDYGHGTHVSGIAAAAGNNGLGITGVSWNAKIMSLKVGDSSGFLNSSDIIQAIYYAVDNGAKVINMSFGETNMSALEQDAINYANSKNVIMFAAAGNNGDSTTIYPAAYNNVIGVGATTNQDQKADFSNINASVDISAPGQDIYSTMPTYPVGLNSQGYSQTYDFLSGTSMASPMAAGLASLLIEQRPALTPGQAEQVIENNADDKGAVGRDNQFGYGRINAYRTLNRSAFFTSQPWSSGLGGWNAANNKLAAGDFNHDGYQDIVSFYNYPATRQVKAWVWLNDGNGNYGAPQMWWDSGPGNWDWAGTKLAAGDFNNDGKDDLVVFYGYAAQRQTRAFVFKAGASNTFNAPTVWWDSGPGNWDWDGTKLQVGDYNGDGSDDLAAFYGYFAQRQARAFVFDSNGTNSFNAPTVWWDSGPGNWDAAGTKLASGDFNNDGKDDLLAFYGYFVQRQTRAFVFKAGASNNFNAPTTWWDSGPGNWDWAGTKLSVGNFDTDPGSDIAALYGYGGNQTRIFVFSANPGANQFNAPTTWWDSGPGNWNWSATTVLNGNVSGDTGPNALDELLGFYDQGGNTTSIFSFN